MNGKGLLPLTTIRDVIGDLLPLENGEDHGIMDYAAEARFDSRITNLLANFMISVYSEAKLKSGGITR